MRSSGAACSWLAYLTLFLLLPASSSAPAGPDNSTAASSIYCTGLLGDGASATSGRSLIFVVQTPLDASDLAQAAACDGVYINVTWAAPVIIPTTIELGYGTTVSVRGELPAGMLPPPAVDGAGMRGLFRVGQQAILELYDIQLWNGAVDGNGGCIHARKGASVVCGKGCKMLGCVSGHRGGAVFLDSGSTLLMEDDASIMHNFSDKDGAGVAANAGSSITMSGTATVSSNECPGGGAGIWLEGECTLTMADRSSISNNTIPLTETEGWGAGIYASQFTRILMANHTSISDNFVGGNGGGAFLQYNTSLSMEGYAQLARNYATRGGLGGGAIGGVLSATVAMKDDSALIDNNAFGDNGGALYCWGNCSITMDDRARVEGNRAHNVGGFFLDLGSHLIMRGNSSISDNYPGGVMAYNECFISISGNAFVSRNMRATSGGAINAWSGTRMVLSGSAQITGNWALFSGGGLSVTRGSLNITGNVVIANNSADFRGGGICGSLSEIFLNDDAVIADNLSGLGGGVSLHLGRLRVSGRGSVRRNSAFGSGGGMYVTAGTIILADDAAIEDNSAGKSGAGVFMSGTSQINISNRTRIKRNSASADGGGLSVIASDANIEGDAVEISDNSAGRTGGGIALTLSSLLVKGRSVISGNTATGSGGAIYIRNSLAELQGDIAISSNEADVGGGVFVDHDGNLRLEGSVALVSNFARKGGGAIFAAAGAVLNAEDGTLFSLNEASRAGAGILFDSQAVPAGTIQISAKSVFVDNLSGCCAPQPLGTFPAALLGNENAGCSDLDSLDDVTDRVQGKYECCGLGEYSHPLTQECTKCQEGVDGIDCNALASKMGAQVESLPLARGFWRATPRSLDIVECEISAACAGGEGFGDADDYCSEGSTGPYCSACKRGYTHAGYRRGCINCSKHIASRAVVGVLIAVGTLLVLWGSMRFLRESSPPKDAKGAGASAWYHEIWARLRFPIITFQIITTFTRITGVIYPTPYATFLSWVDVINLDLGWLWGAGCLLHLNFYGQLLLGTLLPVGVGALLACSLWWRKRSGLDEIQMAQSLNRHIQLLVVFLFLIYSTESSLVFQTFVCEEVVGREVSYLRADRSISCDDPEYKYYRAYAWIMVAVYPVGILAVFTRLIWRDREQLMELKSVEARLLACDCASTAGLRQSKFLWQAYRAESFYYELVECCRRLLLTGVLVFFQAADLQIMLACLFSFMSLLVFASVDPLEMWMDTLIYCMGAVLVLCSMLLAASVSVAESGPDEGVSCFALIRMLSRVRMHDAILSQPLMKIAFSMLLIILGVSIPILALGQAMSIGAAAHAAKSSKRSMISSAHSVASHLDSTLFEESHRGSGAFPKVLCSACAPSE